MRPVGDGKNGTSDLLVDVARAVRRNWVADNDDHPALAETDFDHRVWKLALAHRKMSIATGMLVICVNRFDCAPEPPLDIPAVRIGTASEFHFVPQEIGGRRLFKEMRGRLQDDRV